MTNSEGRGRCIPVIMAMWLVPMATETMFSELIRSEPKRVKTKLLLILPGALGTGRAGEELSVCTCMCVCLRVYKKYHLCGINCVNCSRY